jgi:hypothetical protein
MLICKSTMVEEKYILFTSNSVYGGGTQIFSNSEKGHEQKQFEKH